MKTKLDNLVCNAHMTFLDTPAVKGCSDLVFKTSGISTQSFENEVHDNCAVNLILLDLTFQTGLTWLIVVCMLKCDLLR